jgi:putative heme-binding domain-containing protein
MPGALRSVAVDGMTSTPAKAEEFAIAVSANRFGTVDGYALEKVSAALGNGHPALETLLKSQKGLLKQIIRLSGDPSGRVLTNVTLDGPFTVECWIRLDGDVGAEDGLLGRKGGADFNFFDGTLRVFGGPGTGDLIVASRPVKAKEWIHCAITRDASGRFTIYLDGEPDPAAGTDSTEAFTGMNLGETNKDPGSSASYDEYRIWNVARTAEQIRMDYRTSYSGSGTPAGLVMRITGENPGFPLEGDALVFSDNDFPELVTPAQRDEAQKKFLRFRALAEKPGDIAKGRALGESTCLICHQVNGEGMAIGPDLSGAGAMGIDSLLRNILTPNEQLESGYYRHDVSLRDGTLVSGFLSSQDETHIVLRQIGTDERVIPRAQIASHKVAKRSLMPEGLIDGFTDQQVADLFTYLMSLK